MSGRFNLQVAWAWAGVVLALLLVWDLAEAGLYVGHILAQHGRAPAWLQNPIFNMNREFGLGEGVEYAKALTTVTALAICARRGGGGIFVLLAALHTWLGFDNALALHERIGALVGRSLLGGESLGLARSADLGQFLYLLAFGIALIGAFRLALRHTSRFLAPTALTLVVATMTPGLFGVFADVFQATPMAEPLSHTMLVLIEDGGETVALSLIAALSIGCLVRSATWPESAQGATATAAA